MGPSSTSLLVPLRLAAVGVVLAVTAACDVTREGEEGNFYFAYAHPGVWSLSTDVAVGTRAEVAVYADESRDEAVDLSEAEFDPAGDLVVRDIDDNVAIIEALREGEADLVVTGTRQTDRTALEATAADTVELRIPNPFNVSEGEGAFLEGGTGLVPFDLKAGDTTLIGYGFSGFSADPANGAAFADGMQTRDVYFQHVTFPSAGTVTLKHDLATDLEVQVVAEGAVASLHWEDFGSGGEIPQGGDMILFLRAEQSDESLVFGLHGVLTVQDETPGVCTAVPSDLWGDGTYEVTTQATGECSITATLGSLTDTWTAQVTENTGR